ncbi:unnamed protein product [Prunus armeniaca]|uniref:BHLH domain-containing protein n=1 Tax=Prunus armeniaca TaxID=36596 RepID=A0A6J5VPJ6_PRUAR|nr:hypothetical protein GBA52_027157 [Prunus armeniaca]CAB4289774.1 unnamed protein product [Prunus armeniaca]
MVCQGASQTRFRALKHENGIAGRPTIIVRVIACFQPLQDCQANNSWLFPEQNSAWQLPNLNHMSMLLEPRQQECLPSSTNQGICPCSGHMALPGSTVSGVQGVMAKQTNEGHGVLQHLPPYFQTLFPPPNSYLNEKQSAFSYGFGGRMAVPNANPGSSQKGFFIFDQSGNETKLIYNSDCPPSQDPPFASKKFVYGYGSHEAGLTTSMDQIGPTEYLLHEEIGENHIIEESEMHEDTEEINALLYSDDYDDEDNNDDDGDDNDSDCGEDDEVKSTGQSPIDLQVSYGKEEHVEELTEKVICSDASNKRHKLLNGGYRQLSPMETVINSIQPYGSYRHGNNMESSYGLGQIQGEEILSTVGKMKSKKDSIRETIRVLESVIPGAKGKDPVFIIDKAIEYLKSMKLAAETLGVSFHEEAAFRPC